MKTSLFTTGYFVQNEVCSLKLKTWKVSCDFCSYSMDIIKRKFGGGLDAIWLQLDMFPRCTHKGKNMFMSASVLSSSQRTFNSSVHKDY